MHNNDQQCVALRAAVSIFAELWQLHIFLKHLLCFLALSTTVHSTFENLFRESKNLKKCVCDSSDNFSTVNNS